MRTCLLAKIGGGTTDCDSSKVLTSSLNGWGHQERLFRAAFEALADDGVAYAEIRIGQYISGDIVDVFDCSW